MKDLEVDLQGNEHTRFILIFSVLILQFIFLVSPPKIIKLHTKKKIIEGISCSEALNVLFRSREVSSVTNWLENNFSFVAIWTYRTGIFLWLSNLFS
jgi:hypothetical protein